MAIQALNQSMACSTGLKKVSFGDGEKTQTQPQTEAPKADEKPAKTPAEMAKSSNIAAKTVASLIMPGLGQLWNKENDKGFKHLIVGLALYAGAKLLTPIKGINRVLGITAAAGSIGFRIYSAIDANKGAKTASEAVEKK